MGADAAVPIAVQGGGVTTGSTITFAGNEIDKGFFLGLLHGLPLLDRGSWWLASGKNTGAKNVCAGGTRRGERVGDWRRYAGRFRVRRASLRSA